MAKQPINVTAATLTVDRDNHAGTVVTLNRAAGITVTLPASTGKGDEYDFYVGTTVSSNSTIIKVANSTDILQGVVHLTTDIAGTSMPTSATSDTITMNGSTTGGVIGSWVKVKDVALGFWRLEGGLICTGTEATPFSAGV